MAYWVNPLTSSHPFPPFWPRNLSVRMRTHYAPPGEFACNDGLRRLAASRALFPSRSYFLSILSLFSTSVDNFGQSDKWKNKRYEYSISKQPWAWIVSFCYNLMVHLYQFQNVKLRLVNWDGINNPYPQYSSIYNLIENGPYQCHIQPYD